MNIVEIAARDPVTSTWTLRQLSILIALSGRAAPFDFAELAADQHLPKPALSRNLTTLVALGYVRRRPDKGDRRRVWVSSTPEGDALVQTLTVSNLRRAGRAA